MFYKHWYGFISQLTFTCSKLIIETLEESVKYVQSEHWCRFSDAIVNFEHISPLFLVFLLLTLNRYILAGNDVIE